MSHKKIQSILRHVQTYTELLKGESAKRDLKQLLKNNFFKRDLKPDSLSLNKMSEGNLFQDVGEVSHHS